MAIIQRPELPADLREAREHCQRLVVSCQVLRALAIDGFDHAAELDPELFDDDADPDPFDRDYLAGKFIEVLSELDQEIREAELGWADDNGEEFEPLVPFSDAVSMAHHCAAEALGSAMLNRLAGRTFHETALELPSNLVRYWRQNQPVDIRVDFRESFSPDDWEMLLPAIDYAELHRQIASEANRAWERLLDGALSAPAVDMQPGQPDKQLAPEKFPAPSPEVAECARYINQQRRRIAAGSREYVDKMALIREHCGELDAKAMARALQPSRYGYLLEENGQPDT